MTFMMSRLNIRKRDKMKPPEKRDGEIKRENSPHLEPIPGYGQIE